eukprot:1646803-Alexandrium_andersonii.AAC.1
MVTSTLSSNARAERAAHFPRELRRGSRCPVCAQSGTRRTMSAPRALGIAHKLVLDRQAQAIAAL